MRKVLTASSNENVISTVRNACKLYPSFFATDIFDATEDIIRYIDYELPEIKVIDFTSENIDCDKILQNIAEDTWLHYGGVIAVCKSHKQVEEIERRKNPNILAIQTIPDFQNHFVRILRILYQNQRFLFNRGMSDIAGTEESGSFIFGNDSMDCRFYTNFLVNYLYNTNRISDDDRFSLQMTFSELVTNALEHGNLEIDYATKTEWLGKGGNMIQLIQKRAIDPRFAKRRIKISYDISRTASKFSITDDGNGFDWKTRLNKDTGTELHGRGISLSQSMVSDLHYNDKGNEVSFEITNIRNTVNNVPGMLKPFDTVSYKDKQVVCRQHEVSNDLYFIVSGRYAVYSGRKLISVLTPNDMFIGEMAFLLNDRRSATILAVGDCKLIRIPKQDFLSLIRRNPHYGIFLSKMLAQRLIRQTDKTLELANKINEITRVN